MPESINPCGVNQTVYYYDAYSGKCEASQMGNCGYKNSYASEEECERYCGAFRGVGK